MTKFTIHPAEPLPAEEREAILVDPGFGSKFSDHMARIDWTADVGWHDHRIEPYGPFVLDPASAVLHYAQEAFEGLKAYAHADGSIWRFRTDVNAARFQRSAARLGLPQLSAEDFLASVDELVRVDRDWVPTGEEQSLYVRPFMFARSEFLAVKPSSQVSYAVIASPSGSYFGGTGVQPVDIWFTRRYSRAAAGGTGFAKCGGNYASSMVAQLEAEANGCSQVGFVDALEHRYVEELGGMNLFVVTADGRIVTPALGDSILEGVTRSAVLELAAGRGLTVEETRLQLDDLYEGIDSGRVKEVFACGTAAVITPVASLKDGEGEHVVAGRDAGEVTLSLREELVDIQYGRREDEHGWMHRIL